MDRTALPSPKEAIKLADSLKNAGADQEALTVLASAHRRFPANGKLLSAYGRQALAAGRDESAWRLLKRALDANPNDWRALSAMATLEERAGDVDAARLAWKRALALSGGDSGVLNNLGMSYLLSGDTVQAIALFRQALALHGLNARHAAQLKKNLAVALAVTGQFDLADHLAGKPMPHKLMNARGNEIASFMGMTVPAIASVSGWTAYLADASEALADLWR